METVIIKELDLIDPSVHGLIWDILDQIAKFHDYDNREMTIRSDNEFLALFVDGAKLTSGEDFHVLARIKQINRENGYY